MIMIVCLCGCVWADLRMSWRIILRVGRLRGIYAIAVVAGPASAAVYSGSEGVVV